jgi:hypothetical protein
MKDFIAFMLVVLTMKFLFEIVGNTLLEACQ